MPSVQVFGESPEPCRGLHDLAGASRGPSGRDFWKGQAGKVSEAILDPHKTRKTPSRGMERTNGTV